MRCEWTHSSGQCPNDAMPGSRFCVEHSAITAIAKIKNYSLKDVALAESASGFMNADDIKSLREEIALTRALLERRLNLCKNDSEIIGATSQVVSMITTIDKLVNSCNNLEKQLGQLLRRDEVIAISNKVVQILIDELEGTPNKNEIIDRVVARVEGVFADE